MVRKLVETHFSTKNKNAFLKLRRKILSHPKAVRGIILVFIVIVVAGLGIAGMRAVSKTRVGSAVGLARDFLFPSTDRVRMSGERINILILGRGGQGHESPDLTDTVIVASISTTTNQVTLISIPRDIWIPDLKDKINSVYGYGRQKGSSVTGLILAKSTVEEIVGLQINYGVNIDFSAFEKIIDGLGGIEVEVKTGFRDSKYPLVGKENDNCGGDKTYACRYETITFGSGVQTMNGETALKFVRSRHGDNEEGNDIARERRQQLVIASIIRKVSLPETLVNLERIRNLVEIIERSVESDMTASEGVTLVRYLVNSRQNVKSYTIPEGLLYNPPDQYKYFNSLYNHAFVFVPARKDGKWDDVFQWIDSVVP